MYLFILIALFIYSAMHLLVFWGVQPLLVNHPAVPALVGVWMALMALAPFGVRLLERLELELAARAVAWIGFTWMGFVFLAFSLFALLASVELVIFIAGKVAPSLSGMGVHGALSAASVSFVVLVTGLYGIYEAKCLKVEHVTLSTDKMAPSRTVRIAQVSDLHLGLINREEMLAPVIVKLNELKPDLIVATGDVVDAQINHIEELSELWQQVDAPLGKYAILGNHETYAGLKQSIDFLLNSGFTLLRNELREVGPELTLVGLDFERRIDASTLLENSDSSRYSVVLKHVPTVDPKAEGLFDLQLSGHTHKGQIFPFNFLTALRFPMIAGLYELSGESRLYTNRGTGTWGPPMRVGSVPEITLFKITGR